MISNNWFAGELEVRIIWYNARCAFAMSSLFDIITYWLILRFIIWYNDFAVCANSVIWYNHLLVCANSIIWYDHANSIIWYNRFVVCANSIIWYK